MIHKILCTLLSMFISFCPVNLNPLETNSNPSSLIPSSESEINICPNITFDTQDDYILDTNQCGLFYNNYRSNSGANYYITTQQFNDLNDYEIIFTDEKATVYQLSDLSFLENHVFGEITLRICSQNNSEYYLLENDWDYNQENQKVFIDASQHMELHEFINVCKSIK